MIFFGTRGKTIVGKEIEEAPCPSCGQNKFITFGVLRYFHLYWIPTFITSKSVGVECLHCKKTLMGKEISADTTKHIKQQVFNKGNTLPMFSGLFILAAAFLFMLYIGQRNSNLEDAYLAQPKINDMYIVNMHKIFPNTDKKYKYGLMRIRHIGATKVEFQVSKVVYNKTSGLRKDIRQGKASSADYYTDQPFIISLTMLKKMGAIFSVKRL